MNEAHELFGTPRSIKWNPIPGEMENTDWAYLAGLIDGDGSIYMKRQKKNPNSHHPAVVIHMNEGPWIDAIRKTKIGNFYRHKRHGLAKKSFQIHWNVQRIEDVLYLLENLLPYLRVKHDTALRMITAIQTDTKESFLNQNQMKEVIL